MIRKITALFIGFLLLNLIVIFGQPIFKQEAARAIIASFIGGFCTGAICKKRGALYGALLLIIYFTLVVIILSWITYRTSEGRMWLPELSGPVLSVVATRFVSSLFFGVIGGTLGELLMKRRNRTRQ